MKRLIFLIFFFLFCQRKNLWENDRQLVNQFINENKNIISLYSFLERRMLDFSYSSPIFPFDTLYKNQKIFEKIAHLLGFYRLSHDTFSLFNLRFFIEDKDTFCEISYLDSMRHCISIIRYDSLWQIFFNESLIIKKIYQEKEYEKIYPIYLAKRFILKKSNNNYQFYSLPFAHSYYPSFDTAPRVNLIFLNEYKIDTSFFNKQFLINDLPSFSIGDTISIKIFLEDTLKENLIFLHYQGKRIFLDNTCSLRIRIEKIGLTYLTIEILTHRTLFYFKERFIYHIYQIPIYIYNNRF